MNLEQAQSTSPFCTCRYKAAGALHQHPAVLGLLTLLGSEVLLVLDWPRVVRSTIQLRGVFQNKALQWQQWEVAQRAMTAMFHLVGLSWRYCRSSMPCALSFQLILSLESCKTKFRRTNLNDNKMQCRPSSTCRIEANQTTYPRFPSAYGALTQSRAWLRRISYRSPSRVHAFELVFELLTLSHS